LWIGAGGSTDDDLVVAALVCVFTMDDEVRYAIEPGGVRRAA
jgi:hypothetical protein